MSPDLGLLLIAALGGWWRAHVERRRHDREIAKRRARIYQGEL